jgi:hypothetical protein
MSHTYPTISLYTLADTLECKIEVNKQGLVEVARPVRFSAPKGMAFEEKMMAIGSCFIPDEKVTCLLLKLDVEGDLRVILGTSSSATPETFVWFVDASKSKDLSKFDDLESLPDLFGMVGAGLVKCFMQKGKNTPWHERDLNEFLVL